MTYEMFRRQERERFIIDYMNYQNSSNPRKILISPLKIGQYYEAHKDSFKVEDQVNLRMIVLDQPSDKPPGTARQLADEILAKINSGIPFAEMAAVNSSGSHRADGGAYGWQDRSYFKPELAQVAFSLKPGQHSGVIELPKACYLLQIDDARPAHVKSLSEVRDEIERTLKAEENTRLRKKWIERLKNKSFIWYY
jgi:parvulin-like peptidyl-prolyl isomerase